MRQISQALQDHDLIVLRVIAEWWDLDLFGEDKKKTVRLLSQALEQIDLAQAISYLPAEESAAIQALVAQDGRIPVAQFSRQFGEIREMGPAALEREEPWFSPQSPAEDLWYRGLIYKGFDGFDQDNDGLTEYIYLPDEFMASLDGASVSETAAIAKPAPAAAQPPTPSVATPPPAAAQATAPTPLNDPQEYDAASFAAVDDGTTLLTLAQSGQLSADTLPHALPYLYQQNLVAITFLLQLLEEMNLLRLLKTRDYRPTKAAVSWLKLDKATAQQRLFDAWQASDWNALRHVPSLACEGSGWYNDPIAPRTALLAVLPRHHEWVAVSELVEQIKATRPDFQRPNGNYDTWYIRDTQTGRFLAGFEQWEAVEGQLLHYIVHGPLTWMGMIDRTPTALRLTPNALRWLNNEQGEKGKKETVVAGHIALNSEGLILVNVAGDRFQRFQVGRFAELQPATDGETITYRITPASLALAKEQGITPSRIFQFLADHAQGQIPAGIKRAIERWDENGVEARLEKLMVLKVADPAILKILREHPKTRPLLGESLGELAVAVQLTDWETLFAAAAQLGLLLHPQLD